MAEPTPNDNIQKTQAELAEAEKKAAEANPNFKDDVKQSYGRLTETLKEMIADETLDANDETTLKFAREQVEGQLKLKIENSSRPTFVELKGNDVAQFIEAIAAKYKTTVEQIAQDNPNTVKKVMQEGGGFSEKHIGKHYVLANAVLKVRTGTERIPEEAVAARGADPLPAQPAIAVVEAQPAVAEAQPTTPTETLNPDRFKGKEIQLPDFLQGRADRTNDGSWAEMLTMTQQKDNAEANHIVQVLSQEPLGWSPTRFREVIQQGDADWLSFDDITRATFGETEEEFINHYKHQLTVQNKNPKQAAETDRREKIMLQADQIFKAMEAMTGGRLLREKTEASQIVEQTTLEKAERLPISDRFDLQSVLDGNPRRVEDDETKESIGTNPKLVQDLKRIFEYMGAPQAVTNAVTADFAVQFLVKAYGMDELTANGSIKSKIDSKTKGTILFLEAVPSNFNLQNSEAKALVASLKNAGGQLQFGQRAMENFYLRHLESTDARALRMAEQAFQNRGETVSFESAEAGRKVDYENTNYLSREKDAESALTDLLTHRRTFENGQEKIDTNGLRADMDHFLYAATENYAQVPELAANGAMVRQLETAGIRVTSEDKEKISHLEEGIDQSAEYYRQLSTQLKEAEFTQSKQPTPKRAKNIDRMKQEMANYERIAAKLRTQKADTLAPYVRDLYQKLKVEKPTALTPQQKNLIQIGYRLTGGRRTFDRARDELTADLNEVIDRHADQPIVAAALEQLAALKKGISKDTLEAAAKAITDALATGFTLVPIEQAQADAKAQGFMLGGIAGATESVDGNLSAGKFGVVIPPIKIPDTDTTIHLGVGIGSREAGIGAGVAHNIELEDRVNLTVAVHAGAGVQDGQLNVGASASTIVAIERGDFVNFIGTSVGAGINGAETTPGAAIHLGFKRTAESYHRNARTQAEFKAGITTIQNLPEGQQLEAIAQMPEFRDMAARLSVLPQITRNEILKKAFETYNKEMTDQAESNLTVSPISGINLSIVTAPPFLIPMVSFMVRGKTQVVFSVPKNETELFRESGKTVEQKLRAAANGATMDFVQDPMAEAQTLELSKTGYSLEGDRILLPSSSDQLTVSRADVLKGNLDTHNTALSSTGLRLSPQENGLLKLDIAGVHEGEEVEIVMDPAMKARLIRGSKAEGQELYLAMDQLKGDLLISREEFIFPKKRFDTVYKHTRITIKDNPARANADILNDPTTSRARFRGNSNIEFFKNGETESTIMTWEEFEAARPTLEAAGLLSTAYLNEDAAISATTVAEATKAGPEALNVEALTKFAKDFYTKNAKLCLESTLTDGAIQPLIEALTKAAAAQNPALTLDDKALNFTLTVIRKETYVKGNHASPEAKTAYLERNRAFFHKVLTDKFGDATATRLLEDLAKSNATLQIPGTHETFTVVGRNGITGLRADTLGENGLQNAVDYTNDAQMREALLAALRELPSENADFLRTSLALHTYEVYGLLKGPTSKKLMDEIYAAPALITDREDLLAAFTEFKATVTALRNAELKNETITLTNEDGLQFVVALKANIHGGTLEYCDNPTVAIDETLQLVRVPNLSAAVLTTTLAQVQTKVHTPIYEFLAGGGHTNRNTPRPHKITPEEVDAVGENETPNAGEGKGPTDNTNLGTIDPEGSDTPPEA